MESSFDYEAEIQRLQQELENQRRQNLFLRTAIDHMPNPVFIKNKHGKFVFFNHRYAETFGITKEQYLGKTVLDLHYLPIKEREKYQTEDLALIENASICSYDMDFVFADGYVHPSFYWSKGFICEETGEHGLVGEIVDISKERDLQNQLDNHIRKLKKDNSDLERESETDAGTGLYNRLKLSRLAGQNNEGNCILMLDLDHFKRINDTFGHLKGDEILYKLSSLLKAQCRTDDVLIRYGGEEFFILLNNVTLDTALSVAERIRRKAEEMLLLPDDTSVTASIGCTEYDTALSLERNIAHADEALYYAKHHGRNRVSCYHPEN